MTTGGDYWVTADRERSGSRPEVTESPPEGAQDPCVAVVVPVCGPFWLARAIPYPARA